MSKFVKDIKVKLIVIIIMLPILYILKKFDVERSTIQLFIYSAAIIFIIIFVIAFFVSGYRMIRADRAVKNLKAKVSEYEQYVKDLDKE